MSSDPFQVVSNFKEIYRLLYEGAKIFAPSQIWTRERRIYFETHLTHFSEKQGILQSWYPHQLNALEINLKDQECFFSFGLDRARFFFQTALIKKDQQDLVFQAPKKLFKIQRRRFVRLSLSPETYQLETRIEITLEELSLVLDDIGEQGFSCVIKGPHSFKKGDSDYAVSFTIRKRRIQCQAAIRSIQVNKDGSSRVRAEFIKMKLSDRSWIAAFVFDEMGKRHSKLIDS